MFAVESDKNKIECGKQICNNIDWCQKDIFSKQFLFNYVIHHRNMDLHQYLYQDF